MPAATPDAITRIRSLPFLGGALLALAGCSGASEQLAGPRTDAVAAPVAASLAAAGDTIADAWIVQLDPSIDDVPGLARQLVAQHGGRLTRTYREAIRGFAVEALPAQAVEALRRNPNVAVVEPDLLMQAIGTQSLPGSWGLDRIDQRTATFDKSYTYPNEGAGVTAYVFDTGIRFDHVDFRVSATDTRSRAKLGYDAIGDGQNGADCNGHGTHVAGTVGGLTYGVAKQVSLVSMRVLGCGGSGSTSGIIAAIDWMIQQHASGAPAVANMSLGGGLSSTLNSAVQRAIDDGIVMAVAAGNSAADACGYSPASAPNAITIGASMMSDSRASFSNYGNCVDFFAPGNSIVSAFYSSTTATATYSGTSMASPHVAGAAALYLVGYPGSTPAQVRDGLFAMATQGIVTNASSANNHLLYVGGIGAGSPTPPPPPPANVAPAPSFTYSCTDLACSFTDRSTDTDGSIASRSWSFGDGSGSSSANPSRTYASAGSYLVRLTVTDDDGASASTSQTVTVTAPATPPPPPAANIVLSGSSRTKGSYRVDLTWTGATATSIDIYRNGARVATVTNTGAYSDGVGKKRGTYTHHVCHAGTTTCSNTISTTF